MIKIDNTLDIDTSKYKDWKIGCTMPMYLVDALEILGEPITHSNLFGDQLSKWMFIEHQKDDTIVYAELVYDVRNVDYEVKMTFDIHCHCDRSFEIVGEYIRDMLKSGSEFVTTSLESETTEEVIPLEIKTEKDV
tara:strand:+ start:1520 stop:1924 length:405 start_codon:yes stop_codon:yes gene_type:complete